MAKLTRIAGLGIGPMLAPMLAALPALAQDAAAPAMEAATETAAAVVDKGDVAWMMTATLLVLFMILPGLALFYGGLVRTKNMLSVPTQCTVITALVMVIWVLWGYSFAFGGGTSPYWGGPRQAVPGGRDSRFRPRRPSPTVRKSPNTCSSPSR